MSNAMTPETNAPSTDAPPPSAPASDNPYQSPVAAPAAPAAAIDPMDAYQDDIELTEPTGLVKAGAFLTIATGLITALTGFQLLVAVTIAHEWLRYVPYLLLLGGVVTAYLGWMTYRTRGWAAIGATVACGILTIGMGFWVLLSAASGFFSLLALLLPPLALVSTIFGALAIGPCQRADAARQRLREAGIEMTF